LKASFKTISSISNREKRRLEAVAREILSKLGSDAAAFIVAVLERDANAILAKLAELLLEVSTQTIRAVSISGVSLPAAVVMPDIPTFLVRRKCEEEVV
jgi:hypothetical protein